MDVDTAPALKCPRPIDAIATTATSPLAAVACSALEGNIWDASIHVFDYSGSPAQIATLQLDTGASSIAWTARSTLAVGADDGDILLLSLPPASAWSPTAQLSMAASGRLSVHDAGVTHVACLPTPSSATSSGGSTGSSGGGGGSSDLLSASVDGTLALWALDAAHPTLAARAASHSADGRGVTAVCTGALVACGGGDGLVTLWDTRSRALQRVGCLSVFEPGRRCTVSSLAWCGSGAVDGDGGAPVLAVGSEDGYVTLHDTRRMSSGTGTSTVAASGVADITGSLRYGLAPKHAAPVCALLAHPAAPNLLVVGSDDTSLACYDLSAPSTTGEPRHAPVPVELQHSGPGAAREGTVSGPPLQGGYTKRLLGHTDYVRALAWLPNSGARPTLLSGGRDGLLLKHVL